MSELDTQSKFFRLLATGLPDDTELIIDRTYANEGTARIQYRNALQSIVSLEFSFQARGVAHFAIIGPAGWSQSDREAIAPRIGDTARFDYDGWVKVYTRHPGELEPLLHELHRIVDAVVNTPEFIEPTDGPETGGPSPQLAQYQAEGR